MRRFIIAGNWKMNGSEAVNQQWLQTFKAGVSNVTDVEWIVFPPFVYIPQISSALSSLSTVSFGAQNLDSHNNGAYTGEISAEMLKDFSCRYVLVGHSERRQFYAETNQVVALKFMQAQKYDLRPILCVGETLEQRKQGLTQETVLQQINAILDEAKSVNVFSNACIAYEPVWAIGTGEAATPEQAQEVHAFIRKHLAALDSNIAQKISILYGGSVKASNAKELFSMPDIDGGLIGGASLNATEFLEIGKQCIKLS